MKKIILLLVVFTVFGCKDSKKNQKAIETNVSKPKITLHALDGGTINVNKLELFSQDTTYQGKSKQFADAYYIIEHPKGVLMWDAGLPENLVGQDPFTGPSGAFTVSRKDSLKNQLAAINISLDSIDFIALSHSHFDHIGHANQLKKATWLVQENEYNFVTNDSARLKDPNTYNSIKELTKVQKLNGDHDVFGDGSIVVKSMPGHTIGHQVLYVNLGLEQSILLTGDLYHFEENRKHKIVPSFNYDAELTKKSMENFEAFAKEKSATVIIQHSPKDFRRLKELLNN